MQSNSRTLQKTAILVDIALADGSSVRGRLFMTPQGRLIDVLNDERDFLPVENMDGTVLALAKTAIKQVALPLAEAPAYRGNDPYLVLGVQEGVSQEKLKQAYHQLCLNNHPDRIKGFGLGSDFQELATRNMVRINNAYIHIMRTLNIVDNKAFGVDRQPEKAASG